MVSDHKNNSSNKNAAHKQGLPSRYAAILILGKIIDDHLTLDQLCDPNKGLKEFTQLDIRDQSLARAIVITTLRHYSRIGKILSKVYNRKPPQKARILIHAIEVGAAQILFMDVPTSAAVNLSIAIIKNNKPTQRFSGFANAVLRNVEREKEKLLDKTVEQHPFPQWLFKKLSSDHGKEKTKLLGEAFHLKSNLDITLKNPHVGLANSIEAINLPTGSLRLTTDQPIQELDGFDKGDWWIQDISASLPAKLIKDVAGKDVADLCAAPGGKTMQLAAMGANVTAIDISQKRLELLKQNLERTNLDARLIAGDILELDIEESYDAILLDAPCSATGTGRRHPDVLWNKTPQSIEQLIELQKKLIHKAALMLKENGVLIYANCSLLKDEGENLIAKLAIEELQLDPIDKTELSGLEGCVNGQGVVRTLPHFLSIEKSPLHSGMDGFFIARFKKCKKAA